MQPYQELGFVVFILVSKRSLVQHFSLSPAIDNYRKCFFPLLFHEKEIDIKGPTREKRFAFR